MKRASLKSLREAQETQPSTTSLAAGSESKDPQMKSMGSPEGVATAPGGLPRLVALLRAG